MASESQLLVDSRVLSDLRTSVLDLRNALAEARKEAESVNEELELTHRQLEDVKEARLQEAKQVTASLEKLKMAKEREAELTEALRLAQTGYWEEVRQLSKARSDLDRMDDDLRTERERIEDLESQIKRIKSSRAWRLISGYRRVVNRLKTSG